jgi:hypothetical protein
MATTSDDRRMPAIGKVAVSLAAVALLGVFVFAAVQARQVAALVKFIEHHRYTGSTGNSPVKIVGGSMTFRAYNTTWQALGPGWQTVAPVDISVVGLERVRITGATGPPTDSDIGLPSSWQIEIDGTKADKTGPSLNGVVVSPLPGGNGIVQIQPLNNTSGFYNGADALTWDPSLYPGVRYKDKSSTNPTNPCNQVGNFCESIYQIQVTLSGGTPIIYFCPDGECRVNIGKPL